MNFFSKNRVAFWLMTFLIIVNLTAFLTFIFYFLPRMAMKDEVSKTNTGACLVRELGFTPSQSEKANSIMAGFRETSGPVAAGIRECRARILDELAKDHPDTGVISSCEEKISTLQKQLHKASVSEYLALKEICNPEQCGKLSSLFSEMYGCQEMCREAGQGKGMMHRHGQEKDSSDCSRMCGKDSTDR